MLVHQSEEGQRPLSDEDAEGHMSPPPTLLATNRHTNTNQWERKLSNQCPSLWCERLTKKRAWCYPASHLWSDDSEGLWRTWGCDRLSRRSHTFEDLFILTSSFLAAVGSGHASADVPITLETLQMCMYDGRWTFHSNPNRSKRK